MQTNLADDKCVCIGTTVDFSKHFTNQPLVNWVTLGLDKT